MQNEYNTPANQMKRLQDAGLNPNLIYGSGSANTGIAGGVAPSKPAPYNVIMQLIAKLSDTKK